MAVHDENQNKTLVASMLFVWWRCCFCCPGGSRTGLFPSGSGNCWAMRLYPGRVETISTSSGPARQKTSNTTEPERQALFKTFIVESERLKSGLVCFGGTSLWVKQKACLKRKKSALNGKWQTEHGRTQSERDFFGRFRTAPAPPAEPGRDDRTEKTAHDQGGGW